MEKAELGKLISGNFPRRDAVYVAVLPVFAGYEIKPGSPLDFVAGSKEVVVRSAGRGVGIADPFLTEIVEPMERFWMVMHPGTVTDLRHAWSHPELDGHDDDDVVKVMAERFLDRLCESCGITAADVEQCYSRIAAGIKVADARDAHVEDAVFDLFQNHWKSLQLAYSILGKVPLDLSGGDVLSVRKEAHGRAN